MRKPSKKQVDRIAAKLVITMAMNSFRNEFKTTFVMLLKTERRLTRLLNQIETALESL